MKKLSILIVLFAITAGANAQLKLTTNGKVGIGTNNPTAKLQVDLLDGVAWERAIWARVNHPQGCSYNLWSVPKNKDVFYVCAEGWLWSEKGGYFGSDIALKKNITPIEGALQKVKRLQGIRFQFNDSKAETNEDEVFEMERSTEDFRLGFIAQEVEVILPEVVKNMPDGTKAMTYTDLIAVLVEAIKEQQTQIENMQAMINACCQRSIDYPPLKTSDESNKQEGIIDENLVEKSSVDENNMQGIKSSAKLFQNTPNPFTVNTEIRFDIPERTTSAKLLIHDMQGAEIKSYSISIKGIGSIIIQGSELPAGMYMYTLLVNNRVVDTKKMILTK
jgi:hypothetical protein